MRHCLKILASIPLMISGRCVRAWALGLSLLFVAGAAAQAPSIPPDVRKIMQKIQSGQEPTEAEMKRMEEWGQSMQQQYGQAGAGSGSQAGPPKGASKAVSGGSASAVGQSSGGAQQKLPCPPARASAVATEAPTAREYVALVNSLVDTYGRRLGANRAPVDAALAKAGDESGASGIGAALFLTGAASASVYASAVAAQRQPADLQAANNLAVALDTIPDSKTATQIFLYIRGMQPTAALPALNLGWAYFNSGNPALAQKQFEEASRLGPSLSGPHAGLGVLASCRGDQATALLEFRKSLSKGYSGMVAVGYRKAQQQEPESEGESQAENRAGDPDSGPLPELPVSPDPPRTAASEAAFLRAQQFANQHAPAAFNRAQEAVTRVLALARRAQQNPDGALDLPRVFDKQVFEYQELVRLTLVPVIREYGKQQQQAAKVIQPTLEHAARQAETGGQKGLELGREMLKAWERHSACIENCATRCGGDSDCLVACVEACSDKLKAELDPLDRQGQELAYRMCIQNKGAMETRYAQEYKVWKRFSDSLRASSRDLHELSQPVIDDIWAPALSDLIQANRDFALLALYKHAADGGVALADLAKTIAELECVPPPPPVPPRTAKDPKLETREPDCPLQPPLELGFGALNMTLDCQKVQISGGELLRFRFERNFVKKETGIYVGVGVAASLPKISLGSGGNLSDLPGKSWSPPGAELSASVTAEMLIGIRVNDAGAVQDVGFTSTVAASASAGTYAGKFGITGSVTLENGANVDPLLGFGASAPEVGLPGGLSWTPPASR